MVRPIIIEINSKYNGESRMYVETRLENWDDIFKLYNRFLMAFVFRGHGSTKWPMTSSLERMVKLYHPNSIVNSANGYEEESIKEFRWKYPSYDKNIVLADDDIIEWLSIMQHYGAPTRMVDFSYSLYIALFMAMDSLVENDDCAIWCMNHLICREMFFLNKKELQRSCRNKDEMNMCIYKEANSILKEIADGGKDNHQKGILLVRPNHVNERILRQQGLFAIQADSKSTFSDNLFSIAANKDAIIMPFHEIIDYSNGCYMAKPNDFALIKIVIPKEFRWDIFKSLEQMNITAEMMFPGIEGLARSMKRQRYKL